MSIDHFEELNKKTKLVKDRVRGVVWGESTGLYLYGRPGVSKTHTVRSTLDTLAVAHEYSNGFLTSVALFDLISDNHDRVIVLDDVTAIFAQPVALQILLAALGQPHDGSKVRSVSYKTFKGVRHVCFSGGIICISNLSLEGHRQEVLAALVDRVNIIHYEPSDDEIIALILRLADDGVDGVSPTDARMVANYLVSECRKRGIRPSVRMFKDKALADYKLWEAGRSETHWRDLVSSGLQQQLVELQHPTNDLSRTEQTQSERRIALDIYRSFPSRAERCEEWKRRTGKSEPAFYRRLKEAKAGQLSNGDARKETSDDE